MRSGLKSSDVGLAVPSCRSGLRFLRIMSEDCGSVSYCHTNPPQPIGGRDRKQSVKVIKRSQGPDACCQDHANVQPANDPGTDQSPWFDFGKHPNDKFASQM